LDQNIKIKWVSALRSGKYQQGKGVLRSSDNTYCCLGVLCDILNPEKWKYQKCNLHISMMGWSGETSKLPLPTLGEVEMNELEMNELICMNDVGQSFAEIADFIEEKL
jgi:hypothetical protein